MPTFFNISESHRTFLWLWHKTGTTHMRNLLKNFDFKFYKIVDSKKTLFIDKVVEQHDCFLFEGHEEYKLMVSARNPYSRYVSQYRFFLEPKNFDISHFEEYLYKIIETESNCFDCTNFETRKPDYYVRMEHMYEDYLNIPFIRDSDFTKSGLLEKKCKEKINHNPSVIPWQDYYTQDSADFVFNNFRNYFKFFEYDKNSWKK